MTAPLLEITDLRVVFGRGPKAVEAVTRAGLSVRPGEMAALVGESGSGKSVTAHSVMRLLPAHQVSYPSGRIIFDGVDVLNASERTMRGLRGGRMGMIFQEPMSSLNPLHTVERQVAEGLRLHGGPGREATRKRVLELLDMVGIQNPASRLASYPHQLSGGQRQRVMTAMALANEPDLLIADEPTTALDVTVQARILAMLKELQQRMNLAVLLITHDLGVVRHVADTVYVMHRGEVVESGERRKIFAAPKQEYTRMLLDSDPRGGPASIPDEPPGGTPDLLAAGDVKVWFPIRKGVFRRVAGHVKAVDGVSFSLKPGRCMGLVGESGSGKTTLGLALLRLLPSSGTIELDGRRLDEMKAGEVRPLRRLMQVVFQDPFGSLSPRMTVGDVVAEGLRIHFPKQEASHPDMVAEALSEVGLDPEAMNRYPHEFSGGQRQRIAVARALVLKPRLLVLDEPTSSLDRSVQFQVVELLRDLQARHGLAYLFITHDLKLVRALCHDVMVMRDGKVVESGPAGEILSSPAQPYTRALLDAAFD